MRLDAVRILQLALGDLMAAKVKGTVWEGYLRRRSDIKVPAEVCSALRTAFPSGHANLDRELSRTLAMIEEDDPGTLAKIAAKLTMDSDPVEDIHYLIVLARLRAPRTEAITKRVASALLALDVKISRRHANRDTNWPLRIAELHAESGARMPPSTWPVLSRSRFWAARSCTVYPLCRFRSSSGRRRSS